MKAGRESVWRWKWRVAELQLIPPELSLAQIPGKRRLTTSGEWKVITFDRRAALGSEEAADWLDWGDLQISQFSSSIVR